MKRRRAPKGATGKKGVHKRPKVGAQEAPPQQQKHNAMPRELVGKMLWMLERDHRSELRTLLQQIGKLTKENEDLNRRLDESNGRPGHCPGTEYCEECGECLFCDCDEFLSDNMFSHSGYRCGACD